MTGAGGFLGTKIRRRLQADNNASVVAVREIIKARGHMCAQTTVAAMPQLGSFEQDVLVLCGATYYKGSDPKQIALMRAYNCDFTKLVIERFINGRGRKIIFLSSYMQLYTADAEPYANQYLRTKREVLDYIFFDPKVSVLNLYIYDNWAIDDIRLKFVPMLLKTLLEGQEFNIPAPDTLMDLCDAEALASVIASMCLRFEEGEVSLASGVPLTLREVAELFISSLRLKDRVNFGVDAPHHNFVPYTHVTPEMIPKVKLR